MRNKKMVITNKKKLNKKQNQKNMCLEKSKILKKYLEFKIKKCKQEL